MSELTRIGLLGSGSWATALAKMLCENVEELNWWVRNEDTSCSHRKIREKPEVYPKHSVSDRQAEAFK